MPRTSRARKPARTSRRHGRAPGAKPRAAHGPRAIARLRSLALDIEEPLNDAISYVHALQLIGMALDALRADEGRPIERTARAARCRLDALQETWNKLLNAMARDMASPNATRRLSP